MQKINPLDPNPASRTSSLSINRHFQMRDIHKEPSREDTIGPPQTFSLAVARAPGVQPDGAVAEAAKRPWRGHMPRVTIHHS